MVLPVHGLTSPLEHRLLKGKAVSMTGMWQILNKSVPWPLFGSPCHAPGTVPAHCRRTQRLPSGWWLLSLLLRTEEAGAQRGCPQPQRSAARVCCLAARLQRPGHCRVSSSTQRFQDYSGFKTGRLTSQQGQTRSRARRLKALPRACNVRGCPKAPESRKTIFSCQL